MVEDLSENGYKLPLIDEFYTLQGEGYNTGKAAYFIRIGGCDIGCRWCDTKISWIADFHKLIHINDIAEKASKFPAKSVVITGGEPLIYNLSPLCNVLKNNGIKTFIETSGAYKISGTWDWICLSPKRQNHPEKKILEMAHELKMIIYQDSDFLWAEENAEKVSENCELYLQPEWSRHKEITPVIVEYIKKNPHWKISIQAHKFMKIP